VKVVIVGAGNIGLAIASLLSEEHHDVILVDRDAVLLERAVQDLDIATREGSGTDWGLLEELKELNPDLLIAVTNSDETNLVCCSIAKGLGYPRTIARVRQWRYLSRTRLDFGRLFSVDHFVSPELLAVQDICKDILSLGSTRVENFAFGAVQMRTMVVPQKWNKLDVPLAKLDLPKGVMVGLVARSRPRIKGRPPETQQIIFPHGSDSFQAGDEITLIGQTEAMREVHRFFSIQQEEAQSVVIIGGGLVGYHTARTLLERGIRVRIIDRNRARCIDLAERLPSAIVLNHDATDANFLLEERVQKADVVVACTTNDEVNVHAALLCQEVGCENIIAVVADAETAPMLRDLGISHVVSPRTSASNHIMSITQSPSIRSTSALYENRAKIMELKVSMQSAIVGIPLAELGPHLPKDFLIAVIQNRGRTLVAHGQRILCPGDSAVVISSPKHIDEILELF
jgi:trk/ktr system potassium uptake protein